jgi:chorismate synthase
MFLVRHGVRVISHVIQIGPIKLERELSYDEIAKDIGTSPIECGDPEKALEMAKLVEKIRGEKDSVGGVVEALAIGLPVGLGDPPFEGLEGEISRAIFSIPGVKGIEFGAGFGLVGMRGSEANDQYAIREGKVVTLSNNSGGILGGLSNGMPLRFRVVFKPPSSIPRLQKSIDLDRMKETTISIEGRFDPCIAIRAPPIVEAMLSVVLADHMLRWLAWRD